MIFEDLGLLFFTALLLSLLLTPATIKFAQRIGAMDTPGDRSVHVRIMPRMGGLGMAISIVVALFLFAQINQMLAAFLLGVFIIVVTGVLDDLFQVRPLYKMVGQLLACLAFLGLSGLKLHSFGDILGVGLIDFPPVVATFVSLFAMIGIINAFNLSDGLDGLAAGLAMIAGLFMAVLALHSHNWLALIIINALLGATLGFLKFNTYPAKLFMGDTGSLALGFVVAALVIYLSNSTGDVGIEPITLALILALPIVDTIVVMTTRVIQGKSPVSADRTHLHHRLLALGFSHALVVIIIYVLAFAFGLLALTLYHELAWIQLIFGLAACILLYTILLFCERRKINVTKFALLSKEHVLETKATHLVGKSLRGLRFVILVGLLLPVFFVESIPPEAHNLLFGVLILLLVAYPWKEHHERLNIVYGLFYLSGMAILYVWNLATYTGFSLATYTLGFSVVLFVWSALKIRFKGHKEVFLTSGLEVILILISWFIPFVVLPVLQVSEEVLVAAKTSCLEAIPLLIAMKIVIRRQPDRNYMMVGGLSVVLLLILVVL